MDTETPVVCKNCGNTRLMVIVHETTEATFFLSPDGGWRSAPISVDACGTLLVHEHNKLLAIKQTIFCPFCGQENELELNQDNPSNIRVKPGKEIHPGACMDEQADG